MATATKAIYQKDEKAESKKISYVRPGGFGALSGAIIMFLGAALYFSSGTDLWAAVDGNNMEGYLTIAVGVKTQLVTNLSLWIIGVLVLGIAWSYIFPLCVKRPGVAKLANIIVVSAVPLAIISFIMMMVLVVKIAPDTSATSLIIAETIGWVAIRADDIATAMLIGFSPLIVSFAARRDWMPNWLVIWGVLAGIIGLFSMVSLFVPTLSQFGFLIVPVGMGWMLALGIVLLRR